MSEHDRLNRNLPVVIVLLLAQGVELLMLFATVLSFFPPDTSSMLAWVFAKDIYKLNADWKVTDYHFLIGIVLFGAWAVLRFGRTQLHDQQLKGKLNLLAGCLLGFLCIESFAVYFIFINVAGHWAWGLFFGTVTASVISKIFLPELINLYQTDRRWFKAIVATAALLMISYLLIAAPIAVLASLLIMVMVIVSMIAILLLSRRVNISGKMVEIIHWTPIDQLAAMLIWLSRQPLLVSAGPWLLAVFVISILNVQDPSAVLAKTAFGEHYYHYDFMLMAGAFASSMGNVMGVDQNVFYGLGMPMAVGGLTKWLYGKVTYLGVFNTYWGLCIVYFVVLFFCLRYWLKSAIVAAAAIFLAIKWQVFFTLSYPVGPIYPNGSVLRCLLDIPVFVLLYMHLKHQRWIFLGLAAMTIGLAMSYVPTTGVDLYVALLTYLAGHCCRSSGGQRWFKVIVEQGWKMGTVTILPVLVFLIVLLMVCKDAIFGAKFWQDLMYYPWLYTNGYYSVKFYDNLLSGHSIDFVIGCAIPLLYLATILWIGMRLLSGFGKTRELIVLTIAAYGLSLYHHWLTLTLINNYFMRAIPLVFVVFYWVDQGLGVIQKERSRALAKWSVFLICAGMLFSDHFYQAYPNFWNMLSVRNPMVDRRTAYGLPEDGRPYFFHQEAWVGENDKLTVNFLGNKDEHIFFEWQVPDHDNLKALYAQEFNFTKDAALIKELTRAQDKVPLLSSFEIEMLIQSERRPFFFYFPIVSSRGLYARTFPHTNIYTKVMLKRTIDDIERAKPPYIFMEKVFLTREIPSSYAKEREDLLGIIEHVLRHYHPHKQGYYLVAMKRNDDARGGP